MERRKVLGMASLTLIAVSAIVSLRNLPIMGVHGLSSMTFYLVAAILFLVPTALVSAELASAFDEDGGVFIWVRDAFGERMGFAAIWFGWINVVTWFPTVLAFLAATLAYAIDRKLASNGIFVFTVTLAVFWGATLTTFFGMQTSAIFTSLGAILGTILPGLLIIAFGIWWMVTGQPLQFEVSWAALMPELRSDNLVFFAGVILAFVGMELVAYHVKDARHPQRDYSRALIMALVIILAISVMGSLAIAAVIPRSEMSLIAGLMQAFEYFFASFGLQAWVPWIAILTVIGTWAQVNTWVFGPAKGLYCAVEHGFLPRWLEHSNKSAVPTRVLIFQAVVGSCLAAVFLFAPSVNSAFWVLTAVTAQLASLMYSGLFLSALKLRYKFPDKPRPFKIPGGKLGLYFTVGSGLLGTTFTFFLSFVPPSDLHIADPWAYAGYIAMGTCVLCSPAFLFSRRSEIDVTTSSS